MAHINSSSGYRISLDPASFDLQATEDLLDLVKAAYPQYIPGTMQIGPIEDEETARQLMDKINARSSHLASSGNPMVISEWRKQKGY